MSDVVFDVRVCFVDGTEKEITNVTTYEINKEIKAAYVVKRGYKIFFNMDSVKYIGGVFALDEK